MFRRHLDFGRFSLALLGATGLSGASVARAQESPSAVEVLDPAPPPALESPAAEVPREPRPPRPPPPEAPGPTAVHESSTSADAVVAGPEPEPAKGARLHDGFYLRVGVGANYGRSLVQTNRVSRPDLRVVGMGRAFDVWLGKTIPYGVTLGVNLSVADVSSDAAEIDDGGSAAANSWAVQLGGFLDTYPNPREGYHFGGAVSVAAVTAHTDPIASDYVGGGVGVSVFAGYDAWIAPQLSLGGLLRLGGAVTRQSIEENGLDIVKQGTTYGAQLLATVLYH